MQLAMPKHYADCFPGKSHLAGNSFIVRCHVTINSPMNGRAVAGKTPAIHL